MSFAGTKVLSLESRRAREIAQLIRNQQGDPFVAPSMREAPLDRNEEAFRFAERLFAGEFDMMVLLTGVGTKLLDQALATRFEPGRIAAEEGIEQEVRDGFARTLVASIGPATSEALEEYGIRVDFEPSHPKMGVLVAETAQFAASRQ